MYLLSRKIIVECFQQRISSFYIFFSGFYGINSIFVGNIKFYGISFQGMLTYIKEELNRIF